MVGYSLGDGLGHQRITQFNTAEIGAMSRDLPHMARELVKRMKNDPRVDIQNHWKVMLSQKHNIIKLIFCIPLNFLHIYI